MEQAKILLINDGSSLFYGMAALLKSKGFRTKVSETLEETLETLSICWIDLVIMKLHSGQTDRAALLPVITKLRPGAKLIIMSNQATLPVEAYEVEVDDYIFMPCSSAQLWRQIFSCLKRTPSKSNIPPTEARAKRVNRQAGCRWETISQDFR